jgi:hypothetical protein
VQRVTAEESEYRSSKSALCYKAFDLFRQQIYVNRLLNVAITACREGFFTVAFHHVGCHGNDGDPRQVLHFSYARRHLVAIHLGQVDIHQDQVGDVFLRQLQTDLSILRLDDRKA